jgi:hypothetical protein
MSHRPFAESPSNLEKQVALSNLGKPSQSIEPSLPIRAIVSQLPMAA